jgi:uncharacterized membrane protein SpoIIM required for sporulation
VRIILGASILFPRTFSRFNSLKKGFKDSFKIFLSTVPFTICAGIIEGYVTRHALRMPLIQPIIIFTSLAIVIFYYLSIRLLSIKKLINRSMIQFYKKEISELSSVIVSIFSNYMGRIILKAIF